MGRGQHVAQRKRREVLRPEAGRRPKEVVDDEENAVDVATRGREQVRGLLGGERPLNKECREAQQLDDVVHRVSDQEGNDKQNQRNDKRTTKRLGLLRRRLRVKERNQSDEIASCALHEKKNNRHDNDGNIHRHYGPHDVGGRKSDIKRKLANQST